jgi:hypothetical protein
MGIFRVREMPLHLPEDSGWAPVERSKPEPRATGKPGCLGAAAR